MKEIITWKEQESELEWLNKVDNSLFRVVSRYKISL
jgi:hypothetical protein